MTPTRRTALRSLISVVTVAVAGCTGSGGNRGDADSTSHTEPMTTETPEQTTVEPTATSSPTPYPPDALAVEELDSVTRGVPDSVTETTDVPYEPFRILAVGERSQAHNEERKPHQVWAWNDADESRELTLTLSNPRGTVFERTVSFEANSKLAVVLRVPSDYEFTVTAKGERETAETVELPRSQFDCNDSASDIILREDGSIESTSVTTDMACFTPTPE